MTLKDILRKIGEKNRTLLSYALESDIPQWVEYAPGKFVGVNIQQTNFLMIEQSFGSYSIGSIIKEGV